MAGGKMKRKLLELTEIDCGGETCDGCRFIEGLDFDLKLAGCGRFGIEMPMDYDATSEAIRRLPECLEAERLMKLADDAVALQNIRAGNFTVVDTPTGKAQGPPDSIGE
jgi:hypothetical protein